MNLIDIDGVKIEGVGACVPSTVRENTPELAQTTGIRTRRIAAARTTGLDLCVRAAERLFAETQARPEEFAAIVAVSFTAVDAMPGPAAQAQSRLGFAADVQTFDVMQACAGYGYGLELAALLVRQTGRKVLLLDGDVQSPLLDPADTATVSVFSDAGTATILAPGGADRWTFAFLTKGEKGAALRLSRGGTIAMDGFEVFRFVATDVQAFLKAFLSATATRPGDLAAFVPHQANVYMISQLAKGLGFAADQLAVSCDRYGNPSSASVPLTLAASRRTGRLLLAGFGGGLSAFAARVSLADDCHWVVCVDGE